MVESSTEILERELEIGERPLKTLDELKADYYASEAEAGNITPSDEDAEKWAKEQLQPPTMGMTTMVDRPGNYPGQPSESEK